MPTLIRLFLVLVVLAGLAFAGMVALTIVVDPGEKDVTIRIPARELMPADAGPQIIDVNDLPAPVNVAPRPSAEAPVAAEEPAADAGSAVGTVEVPGAE